jgi:hypothetical protein
MILFINGFEMMHWAKHEIAVRNKQCYDAVGTMGGIVGKSGLPARIGTQAAGYGYCLTLSFNEDKQGNVYSPSRDVTANAPYYKGEEMEYWNPVKDTISKGFKDERLFFINGSSDNRTTGQYRYQVGVGLGEKIIENWEFFDSFSQKFSNIVERDYEVSRFKYVDPKVVNNLRQYYHLSLDKMVQEVSKRNPGFRLEKKETLKLVGHSMGGAIAAGIAAVIARHPVYSRRVEVVLYLAPHQPQDFVHPPAITGYQSSSAEDLVASKNEIGHVTMPVGEPSGIAIYNMFFGKKNPMPYTAEVPISIEWAKGKTAYQLIRNIPPQHFIQNKTHDGLKSQRGHSVYTYKDEIEQFFKIYHPGKVMP